MIWSRPIHSCLFGVARTFYSCVLSIETAVSRLSKICLCIRVQFSHYLLISEESPRTFPVLKTLFPVSFALSSGVGSDLERFRGTRVAAHYQETSARRCGCRSYFKKQVYLNLEKLPRNLQVLDLERRFPFLGFQLIPVEIGTDLLQQIFIRWVRPVPGTVLSDLLRATPTSFSSRAEKKNLPTDLFSRCDFSVTFSSK